MARKTAAQRLRHDKYFGDRPIMIHICKDGTISYRDKSKKESIFNGVALPVFAVDTIEQAQSIQVRFGRRQYGNHPDQPDRPWYKWTDFSGNVNDLDAVADRIHDFYWSERKDAASSVGVAGVAEH